ncbi:hypothetical protein Patl1_27658 [Pistacia atlantica]|uniref:Uncharacterized protein n=1 Tax=Pistacia atlantica TaxID=434234 RepID=A0ACC1BDA0_9ROSI|nr:hypothetical protein Patl1_27658 [Pistacia atlantica]
MMTNLKACFSKHSQWPPESFRLCQARELVLHLSFLGCLKLLNIRSGRLRAFAFARLESLCCLYPSLDV